MMPNEIVEGSSPEQREGAARSWNIVSQFHSLFTWPPVYPVGVKPRGKYRRIRTQAEPPSIPWDAAGVWVSSDQSA
jgi:hypothetical protein